jgi:hypothetical protein
LIQLVHCIAHGRPHALRFRDPDIGDTRRAGGGQFPFEIHLTLVVGRNHGHARAFAQEALRNAGANSVHAEHERRTT